MSGTIVTAAGRTDRLAETFAAIALEAGRAILDIYETGPRVRLKADRSPVSDADEKAEAIILCALEKLCPGLPVVAEEAVSRGSIPVIGREFILVDPLDGTREFLSRNGEFTVNIALVRDGTPCCGAVYAPALDRLWVGATIARTVEAKPGGALPPADCWRPIKVRSAPSDGLTALVSRSHCDAETEAWLAELPVRTRREAGSSLKFCVLAEGEADVYPRFGPTMEWDIAAGHAVLMAAGGAIATVDGTLLRYGKIAQGFKNPGFIAFGDPRLCERVRARM
jgi:3'(2'),5'-bisphosphate nucleotidase